MLDLAAVIRIDPEFSPAEQDRARAAAARDRRLSVALESGRVRADPDPGGCSAAGCPLAGRQDHRSVRVGGADRGAGCGPARRPRPAERLICCGPPRRATAPAQQQAEAPDNWFEQALAYATDKLHGAAAALSPAGAGMGQVAGYTVADYLIQHASRERRYARVPASTWDAILSHIRDPADAARLADSARSRLLYGYAIPLYRPPLTPATDTPPRLWSTCSNGGGDLDELLQALRFLADAGDPKAAKRLVELLAWRGRPGRAACPGRRQRRPKRVRGHEAGRPAQGAWQAGRATRPG